MINKENLVYFVFCIVLFLCIAVVVIVVFIFKVRSKIYKSSLEKKELKIKSQKEILLATIITQEKERERIAKDLHDEISSMLNIQSLNLHSLYNVKLGEHQRHSKIDELLQLNNKIVESARQIAHHLLPPTLDKLGLHVSIEEMILDFSTSEKIVINYSNLVDFENFTKEQQLHIFRIIQELINNSIKHGKATEVNINFAETQNITTCFYADNGIGFDTNQLATNKGLGMHNIESRVKYLNGTFTLASSKEKGSTFSFYF